MKALILKDIAELKKALILSVALSIAIIIYGVSEGVVMMIPAVCAMMPLILTSISYAYDAKANFEQFAFAMPVNKKDYVLSKYFFPFVFALAGGAALFIVMEIKREFPIGTVVILTLSTVVTVLLISAIQLPFVLKYGAEKGKLIIAVTYFLIFGLVTILKDSKWLAELSKVMMSVSRVFLGTIIISVSIIMLIFLTGLSVKIMKNKEY